MRLNAPVTDNEYHLQDGLTIVSTTDLQGNITYANPYFVEVSGFPKEELIGAPQNILRHPDMPAQAFADLWTTIRTGRPWTAMVKNRRANGDYYWVLACGAAVSVVATLAFWSHLNSALIRPLKDATLTTLALAGCDLSQVVHAERADEMGQMMRALRQVNVNLQATGVSQINGAVAQLNQATQENASASEQLAATAEEMNGQAEQLQQLMQFFKIAEA